MYRHKHTHKKEKIGRNKGGTIFDAGITLIAFLDLRLRLMYMENGLTKVIQWIHKADVTFFHFWFFLIDPIFC